MKPATKLPIATLILIAANLLAAFLVAFNSDLAYQFGFNPNHPSFLTVFTGLFLHENLLHLLGNMVFLAAVGASVELATGSGRFAAVYLISGVVGVATHYAFAPRPEDAIPLIGASGCIAGCAGYYSIRYLALKVPLAPKLRTSVLAVTIMWVVLQIVGIFVHIGDVPGGTAFWAHLGGFAAGLLMSLIFRAPDHGQIKMSHSVISQMGERSPAATAMAARRHLQTHPRDIKALRELIDALELLDDGPGEVEAQLQLLELLPEVEQPRVLERLCELNAVDRLSSLRRTLLADKLGASDLPLCRKLLESVIADPDDKQRPEAMLALAGLEWDEDRERATYLLKMLEAGYPLHPAVDVARARGWLGGSRA